MSRLPILGMRYKLRKEVARGMEFVAPAGLTGTVVESNDRLIALYADKPLCDGEDWDGDTDYSNCILWTDDPTIAEEFDGDCELIHDMTDAAATGAIPLMMKARMSPPHRRLAAWIELAKHIRSYL